MSWDLDKCQGKSYSSQELSGVGKQTERSSKGFEGAEWTSWLSKRRKIWSMERLCTSTQKLWRPQNK